MLFCKARKEALGIEPISLRSVYFFVFVFLSGVKNVTLPSTFVFVSPTPNANTSFFSVIICALEYKFIFWFFSLLDKGG